MCLTALDGEVLRGPPLKPALKSTQAKILLHSCVGPSLKPLVMAKNASEAWDEICKHYERRGVADALRLQRELITTPPRAPTS
jgi:hypothetical protein